MIALLTSQIITIGKMSPRMLNFTTRIVSSVTASQARGFLIVQEVKVTMILFYTKLKALIQKAIILLVGA
jgi:hypothetical protein